MPKFPVAGPCNSALPLTKPDNTVIDFRIINCAACTAGALTGRTSGTVVAQVFQSYAKKLVPKKGYEPDTVFAKLGLEARQAKGKGPKFPPPPRKPGQSDSDWEVDIAAVAEESGLHAQVKALKHWVHGQRGGPAGDQLGSVKVLVPFAAAQAWMAQKPSWTEFAVYFTSFQAPTPGHWIYAENRDHTVEFTDYQQDLGPNRPDATKYPSCLGNSAPDANMLVLSFPP
jgi:hypothetical protein